MKNDTETVGIGYSAWLGSVEPTLDVLQRVLKKYSKGQVMKEAYAHGYEGQRDILGAARIEMAIRWLDSHSPLLNNILPNTSHEP